MYGLDLFSGIGGISLALSPWVRPAAYCELDPYARGVLLSRMADGQLPAAPIWDDVRTLRGSDLPPIDIIYGGFPCQDISLAGARAGLGGERSGLYREIIRLADEILPAFVFLENVAAIRGHAHRVVEDLAGLGFDCRWMSLSAAEVGAPHKRDRWWLLAAHPERLFVWDQPRWSSRPDREGPTFPVNDGGKKHVADATCDRRPEGIGIADGSKQATLADGQGHFVRCRPVDAAATGGNAHSQRQLQQSGAISAQRGRPFDAGWWEAEPDVGRVADGVPARMDRLRALGNAVVPAQARQAFKQLMWGDLA